MINDLDQIKHISKCIFRYIDKYATYGEYKDGDLIVDCNNGEMIFAISAITRMNLKEYAKNLVKKEKS